MRHTFWFWFVCVVMLALGGNYPVSLATPTTEDSTSNSPEGESELDAIGVESMSLPALLQEGTRLEKQIYTLLRGLKFPHTIGTVDNGSKAEVADAVSLLREQVRQWKQKAEDFLFNSDDSLLQVNSILPVLYFSLATKILQARILLLENVDTDADTNEEFELRVPVAIAWSAGKAFQDMLTKQLHLDWQDDYALVSLREEFIADIKVGMAALNPSNAAHLQATKHILYRTLYAQLLRNEYYRGEAITLPDKITKKIPERMLILSEHRDSYSQAQLVAALHSIAPRLNMPAGGLENPLHADKNWELALQLRKDFPHLQTFTNTALAAKLYPLIPAERRKAIEVNSQEDFEKFLTLGECLLFPNLLSSAVKQLGFVVDGSKDSNAALARVIRNAKLSAVISVLRQLQIQNRDAIKTMNAVLLQRRDALKIDGNAWHQAALLFLPRFKEDVRKDFVRDLVSTSKRIRAIEDLALSPVSLPILNKSLWRTFHVDDFSGDFQRAIAEVTQSKGYPNARQTYFKQLGKFLQRLQGKQVSELALAKMSVDDIQAKYLATSAAIESQAKKEEESQAQDDSVADDDAFIDSAVNDKVALHHISQAKSFLRYGQWFGFFSNLAVAAPKIDDLPLTDAQKKNYFLELKYALIDRYPLLIIEHDKKPLHELLAADAEDKTEKNAEQDNSNEEKIDAIDATTDETSEAKHWSLISAVLEKQQNMIVETIKKVDKANSASDFKHLLAHSYPISSAMQEYAGLYPIHSEKTEKFSKPSKFWKDLEALDHKYVGAFFMFLISIHLGEWLAGKHPSTRKILRYTTALQSPTMPVVGILASALFAGIIFEWLAVETFKVFVLAPHKIHNLYDYYELGNANDKFLSRTLLDYIELEQKAEKLNYGFEGAMHGIFVGWFGYQAIFKRLIAPKITADKTKKLLQRVGITETHQELVLTFDSAMLRSRSEAQITKFNDKIKEGVISEIYGREQIRQVVSARKKLEKKIAKITRNIENKTIQHGEPVPGQEDNMLMALFRRKVRTDQEISGEIPLQDKLIKYDEALTLALLRNRPSSSAGASNELRGALDAYDLPANFFESKNPKEMKELLQKRHDAKMESYSKIINYEQRAGLEARLSEHRAKINEEIRRILQGMGK